MAQMYGGGGGGRFGQRFAKSRLLLAKRAGYLPEGPIMGDPTQLWKKASSNLARDARSQGELPMQFLRNKIQGGMRSPVMAGQGAAPSQQGLAQWGGYTWDNPEALFGHTQRHGNRKSFEEFYRLHPGLMELFGMVPNKMNPRDMMRQNPGPVQAPSVDPSMMLDLIGNRGGSPRPMPRIRPTKRRKMPKIPRTLF